MRRIAFVVAASLFSMALLTPAGLATHVGSDCRVTSSPPTEEEGGVAIFAIAGTFTVFNGPSRTDVPTPGGGLVYIETNGLPGIQRSDGLQEDETCGHGPDLGLGAGCIVDGYVLISPGIAGEVDPGGCAVALGPV